jgi:two-component system response regulator YesN
MIRVLIADDEPKIRRGLAALVGACEGFQVVAEAENGVQALDLTRKERPDLLLVDIRMPLMDGLEFLGALEEMEAETLTVIVTGHDEFRYAQEAVKLRVFDYVLKPVKPSLLTAVLTKVKEEMEARLHREASLDWARKELERHRELFRELTLRDWFMGSLSDQEFTTQRALLSLELPVAPGLTLVRVQPRLAVPGERAEGSERLLMVALRKLAEDLFGPFGPASVFEDLKGTIVVICTCSRGQEWVDAGSNLIALARQRFGAVAVLVQKPVGAQPREWIEAYEEMSENLGQKSDLLPMVILTENYLERTYMDPDLTLEDVAQALGLSPGWLSRLLKQQTGSSFTDFLARFRIGKAVGMLTDPSVKVQTVAELTGYSSQHYFTRSFKKILGVPPQTFRRSGGNN